jgi:hypothetical protein
MNHDLIDQLAEFSSDPLGFVLFAFPWGEPGELEHFTGPEPWQEEILVALGRGVLTVDQALRIATTSGHGIGKSALVSWIILWAMATYEDTIGVVTANTETQLKTKTWAQLAKWHRLFIGRELFVMTATKLCSADPDHENTWRVDMVPWSERNTEAFAGLHNKGKRIILIFDEASAIPDLIWEVAEGALTDSNTQIIWAVFGNPTKNKGRFRDCFKGGRFAHRWNSRAVDSRTVSITNKEQINEWIKDWGEDSDFVRVRVRGVFPRIDAESFISFEIATEATRRTVVPCSDPVVLGVDVGRFGDDPSVIYPRKGRDAVTLPVEVLYGASTMETAARVAATFLRLRASVVMVDAGGVGGGVVDRLRQLQIPVMEVDFGAGADNPDPNDGAKYANKRAEIWGRMRLWLPTASIPERVHGVDVTLVDELTAPAYSMNGSECIQLESKKEMRKRGVKSPNLADALACSFAYPIYVPVADDEAFTSNHATPDYNPYEQERMSLQ